MAAANHPTNPFAISCSAADRQRGQATSTASEEGEPVTKKQRTGDVIAASSGTSSDVGDVNHGDVTSMQARSLTARADGLSLNQLQIELKRAVRPDGSCPEAPE